MIPAPEIENFSPTQRERPRIPNFGHFLLLMAMAAVLLFVAQAVVLAAAGSLHSQDKILEAVQNQRLQLVTMTLAYLSTLAAAIFSFGHLWERPFGEGIQWNWPAARRWTLRLIGLGFLLGVAVQAAESLITIPSSIPMDDYFKSTSVVWALTFFGTLIAPAFEEIVFRGFLFPALAIGWDWIWLKRTPEAHDAWRSSDSLSRTALIVGGIVSSAAFALIHAAQLGWTWAAVGMLMVVALVLTVVRWKTQSVAASAIVHACYNFSVFVTLFISTGGYRHLEK